MITGTKISEAEVPSVDEFRDIRVCLCVHVRGLTNRHPRRLAPETQPTTALKLLDPIPSPIILRG